MIQQNSGCYGRRGHVIPLEGFSIVSSYFNEKRNCEEVSMLAYKDGSWVAELHVIDEDGNHKCFSKDFDRAEAENLGKLWRCNHEDIFNWIEEVTGEEVDRVHLSRAMSMVKVSEHLLILDVTVER